MVVAIYCAAGRSIKRDDRHAGLDWSTPCPRIPFSGRFGFNFNPHPLGEIAFCREHGTVIVDELWHALNERGLIDPDIVG